MFLLCIQVGTEKAADFKLTNEKLKASEGTAVEEKKSEAIDADEPQSYGKLKAEISSQKKILSPNPIPSITDGKEFIALCMILVIEILVVGMGFIYMPPSTSDEQHSENKKPVTLQQRWNIWIKRLLDKNIQQCRYIL